MPAELRRGSPPTAIIIAPPPDEPLEWDTITAPLPPGKPPTGLERWNDEAAAPFSE